MKSRTTIKMGLAVIVASTFLTFGLVTTPTVTDNQQLSNLNDIAIATPETIVNVPASLIVSKKSNTSMKIKWSKVGNAKGYKIYRYNPKSKKADKFKRVKTIKNKNVKSWTNRKLKYGKTYTYKIKSYTVEGSKTVYSNYSYYAKAKLYKVGAKKINATKLSTDYTTRYVGLKAYKKLKVCINKKYTGAIQCQKTKTKPAVSSKIRWKSSNTNLVKVDKNGGVRTQGIKGTAYVKAIAHNGKYKKFKIVIDDFACPSAFINLNKVDSNTKSLLTERKEVLCEFTRMIENQSNADIHFEDNYLVNSEYAYLDKTFDYGPLLFPNSAQLNEIRIVNGAIEFDINTAEDDQVCLWYYDNDISEKKANTYSGFLKIARGWYYIFPTGND